MSTIASSGSPGKLAPLANSRSRELHGRKPSLRTAAATASEVLWAALLLLVVGFLVARGTALSAAVEDVAAAFHDARTTTADEGATEAAASQAQELAARLARDENHLAVLERKYAELKERLAPPVPHGFEPARPNPAPKPRTPKTR